MDLKCKNCGHGWDYKGESKFYATCPNCHYKVKISAKANVISPDMNKSRFTADENTFIDELMDCENSEDLKEICLRYDQEEFNALKWKVKEKAKKIREDLEIYNQVEDVLENRNWEYTEL
ncbi:MAG: DUF1660 family phage protein [Thermoplasmata archaeon]